MALFYIPTSDAHRFQLFSTTLLTLLSFPLFLPLFFPPLFLFLSFNSHPNEYEVVSHCNFNFHFLKVWLPRWLSGKESPANARDAGVMGLIPGQGTAAAAKSLQSCPTLCDPIDGGPPGSPVPGILQARTLEWVAISFSNA